VRPIVTRLARSRLLRLGLAASVLATSTGCVVAAVGAAAAAGYGAYKVQRNGDAREYEVPFERAWVAAGDAMRESGYPVDARAPQGPSEGAYEFQDVRTGVFKVAEGRTRVEVFVGTFDNADNRRRARLVLDAVSRRLGYTPPS
jgi:hypothetical protein